MLKLGKRKPGWIGVDIGTSTVKIAQVARTKQGWQLIASSVIPRQQNSLAKQATKVAAISSINELKAAQSLQDDYRGRQVAAVLPMSLCDIHRLECDLDKAANTEKLLRQTIETAMQQSSENLQYDYWSSSAVNKQPAWSQVLTVPRVWTDQLCKDVAQAGWSCKVIDGLPLTLTRAVKMVHSAKDSEPIAALDWGNERTTLCFIENGQATYVRCLKNCHTRGILDALTKKLDVTEFEAQQLLEDYGLTAKFSADTKSVDHLVREILTDMTHQVVKEIQRTISHFKFLRRVSAPQQMYLFGGGAMIKDLDNYLSEQIGIATKNWQLPPLKKTRGSVSLDHHADCLLASAISLSAMAWEQA